ncbi:MAG TPA: DUF4019 domain-containing protein [Myxococcales bacterium]|nr:DUF4019 domain-containing protein [Myxococcales bacterium]
MAAIPVAVLLAAVTTAGKPAAQRAALLTLASGHTFRVLNAGPVIDEDKKRLGLAYFSSAQNEHELQADADELFEYLLPRAEEENVPEVVIIAWIATGGDVVDREVVFQRQKNGKWKKARAKKPFPRIPPPPQPDERDLAAERAAVDGATAWLLLLDEGRFEANWQSAAPFLRDRTPLDGWVQSGRAMRAAVGNRVSRKQVAVMETDTVGSAPPGHYVVVEYRSKFAQRPNAFESVTTMLCDDGKWRVAGYSIR